MLAATAAAAAAKAISTTATATTTTTTTATRTIAALACPATVIGAPIVDVIGCISADVRGVKVVVMEEFSTF
jgi:hypothetical protein